MANQSFAHVVLQIQRSQIKNPHQECLNKHSQMRYFSCFNSSDNSIEQAEKASRMKIVKTGHLLSNPVNTKANLN